MLLVSDLETNVGWPLSRQWQGRGHASIRREKKTLK